MDNDIKKVPEQNWHSVMMQGASHYEDSPAKQI
jgi:hypothetical protein